MNPEDMLPMVGPSRSMLATLWDWRRAIDRAVRTASLG